MTTELDPLQPDPNESGTTPDTNEPEPAFDFEVQDPEERYLDELLEYVACPLSDLAWIALENLYRMRGKPYRVIGINLDHSIEVWKVTVEMENREIRTVLVIRQPESHHTYIDPVQPLAVVEAAQVPHWEREIW